MLIISKIFWNYHCKVSLICNHPFPEFCTLYNSEVQRIVGCRSALLYLQLSEEVLPRCCLWKWFTRGGWDVWLWYARGVRKIGYCQVLRSHDMYIEGWCPVRTGVLLFQSVKISQEWVFPGSRNALLGIVDKEGVHVFFIQAPPL